MAAMSEADYKALASRAYAALKNYPNVHSVGIGGRERKGRPTGEIVIKVFVSAKKTPGTLASEEVIPPEFEGVPTDVVEAPEPVLEQSLLDLIPGFRFSDSFNDDKDKYRPLKGGIRIEGGHNIGTGTMGFLARVQGDSRIMGVTNYHVLFDNSHLPQPNLRVGNPDFSEGSCTGCCVSNFASFIAAHYDPLTDIAIFQLDPHTDWLQEIQCIGLVKGFHPLTVPETAGLDYNVRKYGYKTRLTGGKVQGINVNRTITDPDLPPRTYSNGISVRPNPLSDGAAARFSASGDSGSAYVNDDNEIVGVHFSGNPQLGVATTGWGTGIAITDIVSNIQNLDHITLLPAIGNHIGDVQHTAPMAEGAPEVAVRPSAEAEAMARRLKNDLSHSERGRLMTALWLRHSTELNRLVNGNRRVGTIWRRNGGPAIFQHALHLAENPGAAIPQTVDGRPVDECVSNILVMFAQYGSSSLQADLREHGAALPPLGGRSYQEIMAMLSEPNETWI